MHGIIYIVPRSGETTKGLRYPGEEGVSEAKEGFGDSRSLSEGMPGRWDNVSKGLEVGLA